MLDQLRSEAERRGIKPPTAQTLRRYGITELIWLSLLSDQNWSCPVCQKTGPAVKWNTDHDHVPRWRHMEPDERARFVRGILCAFCNHRRVNSRMSAAEAQRIADYLATYENRRDT